jgi:Ser/Thr protein kinase RdoA (MazF antagonist)
VKFLIANSPMFPIELAARLAEQAFSIPGTVSMLYSERDQNFRVAGGAQGDFVLKISNATEGPDIVAAQIAALEFLARTAPDLPLPRVRRTLAGEAQIDLAGEGGARHATFALTYLPGQIASDCPLGPDEFHRIGRMIARIERGLRGFFHRALGDRALLWDIRQLGQLREKCQHLGPDAARIRDLLDEVTQALSGRLDGLAAQVIHGDIHGHNLILGPDGAISGVIDFGDMFHGPAILNLSNALADFQHDPSRLSDRARRDEALRPHVQRVFDANWQVYGVRKVWRQLRREGFDVARCTVARLMKIMDIQGIIRGKPHKTTIPDKKLPCPLDKVNRQFRVPAPNMLWVSDFTYVATWKGFVYVAFVIDAFARRIVGWRVSVSRSRDGLPAFVDRNCSS